MGRDQSFVSIVQAAVASKLQSLKRNAPSSAAFSVIRVLTLPNAVEPPCQVF